MTYSKNKPKHVGAFNLCGGMGKTTTIYFLARGLASMGYRVLVIDLDPTAYLTNVFKFPVLDSTFTANEFLDFSFSPFQSIHPTIHHNIDIIPADRGLENAETLLLKTGNAAFCLSQRLDDISSLAYDFILIDSPPENSNLTITALGASHALILPASPDSKGLMSLINTLTFIKRGKASRCTRAEILGILPFRDKWVANNQLLTSFQTISSFCNLGYPVFTHVLDRNIFTKALAESKTPSDFYLPVLELPYTEIINALLSIRSSTCAQSS
jgi:chromosome partitioning protein